jgi:hypothetical protein
MRRWQRFLLFPFFIRERGGEERRGRNLAVNLQFLVIFKIRTIFL